MKGAASGAPSGRNRTRTCDLFCVREALLPTELSARNEDYSRHLLDGQRE
jgi:hypothetical protein